MKLGWMMTSLMLIAPTVEAAASSKDLQVLYVPTASEAAPPLHPKLKLAKGFPREQAGDELGIKASRVQVLGICASGDAAKVVRDIVRLSYPDAELADLPNDKVYTVACPTVRAESAGVPEGYRKETYPKPGYFTVAEEAPSVVWRFYSRLVELGTTSCRPFEMLARVEAGKYVLDQKRYTGECVPKNAKSGWESREMVWRVAEFRRIGGRGRVELSKEPFNVDFAYAGSGRACSQHLATSRRAMTRVNPDEWLRQPELPIGEHTAPLPPTPPPPLFRALFS